MVAEIQRLENAARIAMGDMHAPVQSAPRPHPISPTAIRLTIAVFAAIGVGILALGLF